MVPWAEPAPNPLLVAWAEERLTPGEPLRTLVIGCGLGDDAGRMPWPLTRAEIESFCVGGLHAIPEFRREAH